MDLSTFCSEFVETLIEIHGGPDPVFWQVTQSHFGGKHC